MERICKHCDQSYISRTGRGLCRTCWDDIAIRTKYKPLAPFGGSQARKMQQPKRKTMRQLLSKEVMP